MTKMDRPRARLGVHSIDHFSVTVPDVEKARHFFTHFGLDVREVKHGIDLYTVGNSHCWGSIRGGSRKRLQYLSLLAFPEDMVRFQLHLAQLNIKKIDPPNGVSMDSEGIWIETPDGLPVQIAPGPKNSPDERELLTSIPRYSPERGAPLRGTTPPTAPKRLGHILLFTADLDRAIKFFADALGLGLSDRSGGVAFMHGRHGSDHHLVAFAQSNGYGLHHSSWTVQSIDEIGLGSERMIQAGYANGWGLGRHVLGSNYFRYVRDPWGSYAEYSFDIDFVPPSVDWEVWTPAPENSFYIWGPKVPDDFVTNYETAED